jgi:fumarate hydratase subunit beta
MDIVSLTTPLSDAVIQTLKAGMRCSLSGVVYSARTWHTRWLCDLVGGKPLAGRSEGAGFVFCRADTGMAGRPIGAAGPTTSARMDAFSPILLAAGLKG